MRNIIIILTSLFLINCNGQDKKDIKTANMKVENFDITAFNKDRTTKYEGEDMTSSSVTDTTRQGTRTRTIFDDGFIEKIEPNNSFFGTYKEYDLNGNLKKIRTKFLVDYIKGFAPWGKDYEYDKNGKQIQETDYNKLYSNLKIDPEKLFDLLNDKNIFKKENPAKYRLSIWFHSKETKSDEKIWNKLKYRDGENAFWEVVMDYRQHDEEPANEKVFKVDAVTGTIIES